MTKTIENADGIYPYVNVPVNEWLADLKRRGILDPLDIDVQLPRILKNARNDIRTAKDPAIRADAKAIIHFLQRLKKGMRQWMQAPALTPLYMEGIVEWAVGIALEIGRLDERCHARQFEPKVIHSTQIRRGAKTASDKKSETASEDYKRINAAVTAKKKKGGKNLSITETRKRVATELGCSYSKVLDAQRGGRKK